MLCPTFIAADPAARIATSGDPSFGSFGKIEHPPL
jgi:hypothetical protein